MLLGSCQFEVFFEMSQACFSTHRTSSDPLHVTQIPQSHNLLMYLGIGVQTSAICATVTDPKLNFGLK